MATGTTGRRPGSRAVITGPVQALLGHLASSEPATTAIPRLNVLRFADSCIIQLPSRGPRKKPPMPQRGTAVSLCASIESTVHSHSKWTRQFEACEVFSNAPKLFLNESWSVMTWLAFEIWWLGDGRGSGEITYSHVFSEIDFFYTVS